MGIVANNPHASGSMMSAITLSKMNVAQKIFPCIQEV